MNEKIKVTFEHDQTFDVKFSPEEKFEISFEDEKSFNIDFTPEDIFKVDFDIFPHVEGGDYSGPYTVTPTSRTQSLRTAGKTLSNDVTVKATPYSRVSNEAGGYTVTIL